MVLYFCCNLTILNSVPTYPEGTKLILKREEKSHVVKFKLKKKKEGGLFIIFQFFLLSSFRTLYVSVPSIVVKSMAYCTWILAIISLAVMTWSKFLALNLTVLQFPHL